MLLSLKNAKCRKAGSPNFLGIHASAISKKVIWGKNPKPKIPSSLISHVHLPVLHLTCSNANHALYMMLRMQDPPQLLLQCTNKILFQTESGCRAQENLELTSSCLKIPDAVFKGYKES